MYTGYFGLKEAPFTIAPNPAYLFMSDRHKEALAHLTYGLGDNGGFILLTGEVGTGKTTICRTVMEQLPDNTQAAFILNPTLSCEELLATLCDELKIRYKKTGASIKYFTDKIHQQLLANHEKGINTLLVIDEAQHLQAEVLEQLRLLTNLETNTKKLLQVILIGQPELQQLLQRRDLRQLAQRITARYHLMPLTLAEVEQYIKHRLSVAECVRPLFNRGAIKQIHQISKGIPRVMNLLCERSLMNAFNTNDAIVNAAIVKRSAVDALGPEAEVKQFWQQAPFKVASFSIAIVSALLVGYMLGFERTSEGANSSPALVNQDKITYTSENFNDSGQPSALQNIAEQGTAPEALALQTSEGDKVVDLPANSTPESNRNFANEQEYEIKTAQQAGESMDRNRSLDTVAQAVNIEQNADKMSRAQDKSDDNEPKEEDYIVLGYQPEKYKENREKSAFSVTKDEGVSDEMLARFQSAIEETNESVTEQELNSEQPTNALFSEVKPIHEMPESLKNALPNIHFQMHIFATDGKGWVRVNGEEKYQGEEIDSGVIITDILPQSVVLSYQGQQFSMPALSSW